MFCKNALIQYIKNISFFSPKNPIRTYQAGLLTQLQRCEYLPGFHQWYLFATPLHSSGPVGDSHSVPFSSTQYTQTPVSSQYSVFEGIIAQHLKNVKPKLFKPSINADIRKTLCITPMQWFTPLSFPELYQILRREP